MEKVTYDSIPQAIELILRKLEIIESKLYQSQIENQSPVFGIKEASRISGRTENAIRCQVKLGNIPYFKKDRKLFFKREEFNKWMAGETFEELTDPFEILQISKKG